MSEQEDLQPVTLNAADFATRLGLIVHQAGLNQSEFAKRMGISAGFLSDVVRGLKKPGTEFLFTLKAVFGVSIDWLLTGEGSMYGAGRFDAELFRAIQLQIAVARAAIIENQPIAKTLVASLRNQTLESGSPDTHHFLAQLNPAREDFELAVVLYNTHLQPGDPDLQRRHLFETAIAYFEANKPVDKLSSLTRSPTANVRIHIADRQINIKGNFDDS